MQIDWQRVLHLMSTYAVCAVTLENVRPIHAEPAPVMPPLVRQPLLYALFFTTVMFALPRVPGLYALLVGTGVTAGYEVPAANRSALRLDTSISSGLFQHSPARLNRSPWLEPM